MKLKESRVMLLVFIIEKFGGGGVKREVLLVLGIIRCSYLDVLECVCFLLEWCYFWIGFFYLVGISIFMVFFLLFSGIS